MVDTRSRSNLCELLEKLRPSSCLGALEGPTCNFASSAIVDIHAKPAEKIAKGKILSYRLQEYPFLSYEAEYWVDDACGVPEVSRLSEILNFVSSGCPLENAHLVHAQVFNQEASRK